MPVRGRKVSLDRLTDVILTLPVNGEVLSYNGTDWVNAAGGGGSGTSITIEVAQTAHGLSVQDAIFYDNDTSSWLKAKADAATTLGIGVVSEVVDVDNFKVITDGEITGLSGLTEGEWYFVSDATAGLLTLTESTIYSNPLLVATSATEGIVMSLRATEEASARYIEAEIDGGFANSVYLVSQHIDGGSV
jgi:hypothetical protein